MALYRLCNICGKKVPYGTKCECEIKAKKDRYKLYKKNRKDKKEQDFYVSGEWINCRTNVATHQFGLDLIEWYKGNTVYAERYHHIIELKDDWNLRITEGNIIGLTIANHIKVHKIMDRSYKDKINMQKYLKKILKIFENEFY